MTATITIDKYELDSLCDTCKAILANALGFQLSLEDRDTQSDEWDETNAAVLGIGEARAFLLGCSEKTTQALAAIVAAGDNFSAAEIEEALSAQPGSLRGVWTGLTKRIRTITGNDGADLFDWYHREEDGSWRGRMAPPTKQAFREALSELVQQ